VALDLTVIVPKRYSTRYDGSNGQDLADWCSASIESEGGGTLVLRNDDAWYGNPLTITTDHVVLLDASPSPTGIGVMTEADYTTAYHELGPAGGEV
jgi:hypothetical protein